MNMKKHATLLTICTALALGSPLTSQAQLAETTNETTHQVGSMTLQDLETGEYFTVTFTTPTKEEIDAYIQANGPYLYEQCDICKSGNLEGLSTDEAFDTLVRTADKTPATVRADGSTIYEAELLTLAKYMTTHM